MSTEKKPKIDKAQIDVFTSFVDTLAEGARALLAGALLQVLLILTLYIGSPHPFFLFSFVFVIASTAMRIILSTIYARESAAFGGQLTIKRYEWAKVWEFRYRIAVIAMSLNIGVVSYFGLFHVSGPFHTSASLTLVFAAIPSVIGRLFGSKPLAIGAIVALLAPPSIGAIFQGDMLFAMLGYLFVPYSFLIFSMVKVVRLSVERAVRSRHEIAKIAEQFDLALNNMTHALLMFDEQHRVVVANERALAIFGFDPGTKLEGRTLGVLLRHASMRRTFSASKMRDLEKLLRKLLREGGSQHEFSRGSGEYLEFSARVREDGTSVLVAEIVTERVVAKRNLEKTARYDGLTGLMNRHHFMHCVEELVEKTEPSALCTFVVLDIDDFKHINDSIGHAQGDRLLQSVADRLRHFRSDGTLVARHGGDEFLVLVPDLKTKAQVASLARKLNTALSGLYQLDGEPVKVGISVGVFATKAAEFDFDDAMIKADIALYRTKTSQKNSSCVYEQQMGDAYKRRQFLKNELLDLVDRRALDVHFQPIIDVKTGKITSCEALARWNHPTLGSISPAEFIPLAEEIGIISKLSDIVLEKACDACTKWPDEISVSVNMSAIDFHGRRIERLIRDALHITGLDPHRLEVEITEGVAVRNTDEVLDILEGLRANGIRISLDDFGTGYSSLSHMHTLPLDTVKIDRSFVYRIESDRKAAELLKGIMNICVTLGRSVTVEGVETSDQLEAVMSTGLCDRVQGFIFGTALPPAAILDLTNHLFVRPASDGTGEAQMCG